MILQQKNLRITDDLDSFQQLEEKLNRGIKKHQSNIVVLNNKLFDKKGYRESMDKQNVVIHNEYMGKLQVLWIALSDAVGSIALTFSGFGIGGTQVGVGDNPGRRG